MSQFKMVDAKNVSRDGFTHWYNYIVNVRYISEPDFSHTLWMYLYMRPVLVIGGIIGNILALLVLFRKNLRGKSFTIYLRALAVCDTGALLGRLLMWINLLRDQLDRSLLITFNSSVQCFAVEYILTSVHACSGWLVVAVAWERAVIITFPLRSRILAGAKVTRFVTFGIVVVIAIIFIYIPKTVYYIEDRGCYMSSEWKLLHYHIALSLVAGLPFVFIAAANIWIVIQLRKAKSAILSSERINPSMADRKVNRMLLVVTFCFLVLLFPNAVSSLLNFYQNAKVPIVVTDLVRVVTDINYAINFYLYVISGEQIRLEVKNILKCA